jgi:transglutaminase-like putative cysteine protease
MLVRISIATCICALLALGNWQLSVNADPAAKRASALGGERWYRLSLSGEHLGYWVTRTHRNWRGQWVFESEQRSAVNPDEPVTVATRRVFAATAPHDLVEAEYSQRRRSWTESTRVELTPTGYVGYMRQARAARPAPPEPLTWRYTLRDYLDFEVWLHEQNPPPGSEKVIRTVDFSRLDVVGRKMAVRARNDTGYQIENPAPQAATTIQLDDNLAPSSVRLAGLFDLTLATRTQALAPRSALQSASYYVPVNENLPNHTQIARLDLSVTSDVPINELWQDSQLRDGEWILPLRANPLSRQPADAATGATLGYPADDQRIRRLASVAVESLTEPGDQLAALVNFVHDYLAYEPGASAQPVLALLDNPVGDCTEFADLLTTLSRSLGIPSRTVFGLAYADRREPAFVYHAWNEVRIDGIWQAVDPTWNQLRVDATHIPLPSNESAALMLLTGSVDVLFELRDVEYFQEPSAG